MGHFGFFQLIKNYAENLCYLMKNIYHKKPLTQPNKVLEGLNLRNQYKSKCFCLIFKKHNFYYINPKSLIKNKF